MCISPHSLESYQNCGGGPQEEYIPNITNAKAKTKKLMAKVTAENILHQCKFLFSLYFFDREVIKDIVTVPINDRSPVIDTIQSSMFRSVIFASYSAIVLEQCAQTKPGINKIVANIIFFIFF